MIVGVSDTEANTVSHQGSPDFTATALAAFSAARVAASSADKVGSTSLVVTRGFCLVTRLTMKSFPGV